jgi:hypothetical protein
MSEHGRSLPKTGQSAEPLRLDTMQRERSSCPMDLDSPLALALIAAVAAIFAAIPTALVTARNQAKTLAAQAEEKREQRLHDAKAELDRYREPLREAARDLAHRIGNIRRTDSLHGYLSGPDENRQQIVLLGTCFRLARFWGVLEVLYNNISIEHFEAAASTKSVGNLLTKIGRTFASDSFGPRFMVWREEQRAIGELMLNPEPRGVMSHCIGFATFAKNYDEIFSNWFASIEEALRSADVQADRRLADLQNLLQQLVEQLDDGRASHVEA